MTLASTLTFCTAMFVLAVTPGPGVFAVAANALGSGSRKTLPLIAGIILGDILYLLFAVFGLSYIAQTMGGMFTIIRLIGGAYLVYLGIKIWRSDPRVQLRGRQNDAGAGKTLLSGLLITLSNPKVILFYCGFLPTFIDLTVLTSSDVGLIVLLVTLVLGTVLCSYSFAADRARQLFSSTRATRTLNRGAATVMVATGVVLATRT